ncbi:MAG: cupin domain-containing protein [Microbacterium sp.]
MTRFHTVVLPVDVELFASDGSEVRTLAAAAPGSLAHFLLRPGQVSAAVQHRTVTELWYITAGHGRMWRRDDEGEEIVELVPGTSLSIPLGTAFQFRCDGDAPLEIVGATMPPWPGEDEAFVVEGTWQPSRYAE